MAREALLGQTYKCSLCFFSSILILHDSAVFVIVLRPVIESANGGIYRRAARNFKMGYTKTKTETNTENTKE